MDFEPMLKNGCLSLTILLFVSCQHKEETFGDTSFFLHEIEPVYETKLVKEINHDPERAGFGQLIHLEMTSNGDFYVTDVMGSKIHMYDIHGNERFIFQQSGEGPGEFLSFNITTDAVSGRTGIYDPVLGRITVMDHHLEDVIESQSVRKKSEIQLELIGISEQGAVYKGFEGYTLYNYEDARLLNVYFQSFESEEPELMFSVPITEMHPTVNQEQRFISADYKPLGRRVSLTDHEGQLIYISNDRMGYTVYDVTGTTVISDSTFPHDIRPYTFNERQIEQHLESMFTPWVDENVKAEVLKELRSVVNTNRELWFQDSFVDVQGRLWFELYPELFDGESRWIVWDAKEGTVFQVLFSDSNIRPKNAIDDTVVVFKRNEFDLETVRIYTFINK